MTFRLVATIGLLFSTALAAQASAQEIPIKPVGAGGRFETQLDSKTQSPGFKPAQVAAFRTQLAGLTDRLIAMPEVNTPTPPLCMRVSSWIEIQSERGLLEASVDVHRPVLYEGKCSRTTGSGSQFWLNRTQSLFESRLRRGQEISGDAEWFVLPLSEETPRSLKMESNSDEYEVFTHGRAPFLRRVTIARVLKAQEKSASGLTAGQLASPACYVGWELIYQENCPLDQQLVELNPAYFDLSRPSDVQVVVALTSVKSDHGEGGGGFEGRRAIWRALDRGALAAMVR